MEFGQRAKAPRKRFASGGFGKFAQAVSQNGLAAVPPNRCEALRRPRSTARRERRIPRMSHAAIRIAIVDGGSARRGPRPRRLEACLWHLPAQWRIVFARVGRAVEGVCAIFVRLPRKKQILRTYS